MGEYFFKFALVLGIFTSLYSVVYGIVDHYQSEKVKKDIETLDYICANCEHKK